MSQLQKKMNDRLQHVIDHRDDFLERRRLDSCLTHINSGTGSPSGCLRSLISFSLSSAISTWFQTGNLTAFKNELYVRNKLEFILNSEDYAEPIAEGDYELSSSWFALKGMFYLVAGHEGLIKWYSTRDRHFLERETNNVKSTGYWTKQFFLALRGEWAELEARCVHILAHPPTGGSAKKFLIDHEFYLALARRDAGKMTETINKLLTPRKIADRRGLEGGYTEDLICTPAILYTKLAWRNGIEIEIDSPYVPAAWMPETIVEYTDPFEFMKRYKI